MIPLIIYGLLILKYLGSVRYLSSHVAIPFLHLNSRRQQFPLERIVIINKKSNLEAELLPSILAQEELMMESEGLSPLTQVRRRRIAPSS